ncbi:MAG TPA: hypothetical protein VF538_18280 [Pyrinomonadaceae bacterium]|jgi:hypothetical protein
MNCQNFRNEIEELEAGGRLAAEAESHAARCRSCRAFRDEGDSLRALVGSLARVEAPGDFDFRLRARIARSEGARTAHAGWRGFVPGAAWLSAAGCLVLALGVFVHFRPGQSAPPPPAPAPAPAQAREVAAADSAAAKPDQTTVRPEQADVSDGETQAASGKEIREAVAYTPARRGNRAPRSPQGQRFILSREAAGRIGESQDSAGAYETSTLDSRPMKIHVGSPIALPVSTQERPLEALFKDTSGATRSVSVDAVTFGARGLPARRAQARNASYTQQGVW